MNKQWRPKGWAHKRSIWLEQNVLTGKMKQRTFEAGADMILEALLDLEKESPTRTFTLDSREQCIYYL